MSEQLDEKLIELYKIKTKIRLILATEKTVYRNVLQRRVAWRLNDEEFNSIINQLVNEGFATCGEGERRAPKVLLNTGLGNIRLETL